MLKPRALRSGDRIAVVAPASTFNREEFDRGVEELRRLGFIPVYDDAVFARQLYRAGGAEIRAAAIRRAWQDPDIAALIGVRGGYGSAQVLPLLDRELARHAAKPFIGYSDLTAVLTFLTVNCGIVAFHGPMLDRRVAPGAAGAAGGTFMRAPCPAGPARGPRPPGGGTGCLAGDGVRRPCSSR